MISRAIDRTPVKLSTINAMFANTTTRRPAARRCSCAQNGEVFIDHAFGIAAADASTCRDHAAAVPARRHRDDVLGARARADAGTAARGGNARGPHTAARRPPGADVAAAARRPRRFRIV